MRDLTNNHRFAATHSFAFRTDKPAPHPVHFIARGSMNKLRHFLPLAGFLLAACSTDTPLAVEPAPAAQSPVFARQIKDPPRANLVWADTVNVAAPGEAENRQPSLVTGDGRDRYGQVSVASEYQGNFCGVYATIDGGLNADPNTNYSATMEPSCGSARFYRFYLSGREAAPLDFGPHHWVTQIGAMTAGSSVNRSTMYGVQQPNCQRLYFADAYPPANHVRVTRLSDVTAANDKVARQWRVESQGSHRAMCIVVGKGGKLINTGVSHYLPFAYTLTEVPAPYPTFP